MGLQGWAAESSLKQAVFRQYNMTTGECFGINCGGFFRLVSFLQGSKGAQNKNEGALRINNWSQFHSIVREGPIDPVKENEGGLADNASNKLREWLKIAALYLWSGCGGFCKLCCDTPSLDFCAYSRASGIPVIQ